MKQLMLFLQPYDRHVVASRGSSLLYLLASSVDLGGVYVFKT